MKGIGSATNARKLTNRIQLIIVLVAITLLQLCHFMFLLALHHWSNASNLVFICI